jgi:hypothetical protein
LRSVGARLWLIVEPALLEGVRVNLVQAKSTPSARDWATFERSWLEHAGAERVSEQPAQSSHLLGGVERIGSAAPSVRALRLHPRYLAGYCDVADDNEQLRPRAGKRNGSTTGVRQTKFRVAARLRALVESHLDPICSAQAIRGSAVALRHIGWVVAFSERALTPAGGEPLRERILADRASQLRRFRDPRVGAAGAFACLGLTFEEIVEIRIGDVETDGSALTLPDECMRVTPDFRAILRAQRISRVRAGAGSDDRFFEGGWEGIVGLTPRHVALMVRVGLDLKNGSLAWREVAGALSKDERWLADRGLTIRRLRNPHRRTTERLESDEALQKAVESMRDPRRWAAAEDCLCLEPHAKPELRNNAFGAYNRPVVGPNHPWRNRR